MQNHILLNTISFQRPGSNTTTSTVQNLEVRNGSSNDPNGYGGSKISATTTSGPTRSFFGRRLN
jgi:hypothetical protein